MLRSVLGFWLWWMCHRCCDSDGGWRRVQRILGHLGPIYSYASAGDLLLWTWSPPVESDHQGGGKSRVRVQPLGIPSQNSNPTLPVKLPRHLHQVVIPHPHILPPMTMPSRGGRTGSNPWGRLKAPEPDLLETIGLPSKGDTR
jgi:hypothetical protein